jgi:hypothetical protein
VLDERHDAAGHESGGTDGLARPCHLNDLDDAPSCRDFDSSAGAGSNDLIGSRPFIGGYDNFHAIALHDASVLFLTPSAAVLLGGGGSRTTDEVRSRSRELERALTSEHGWIRTIGASP